MLYFFTVCLSLLFSQVAADDQIQNLPWTFYLPESYAVIAKENGGKEAIFLAPKDLDLQNLERYSESSIPALIMGIKMQFPNSFASDMGQMVSEIKKQFPNDFEAQFSKWGSYPIVSMKVGIGMDVGYLAYVSFEDLDKNGMMFTFAYPKKKEFGNGNTPSKKDLELWEDFLTKTKPAGNSAS